MCFSVYRLQVVLLDVYLYLSVCVHAFFYFYV